MWIFLDFIRVKSELIVRFLKVEVTISIFLPKVFYGSQSHKKFFSKPSPIGNNPRSIVTRFHFPHHVTATFSDTCVYVLSSD